jgi:phospholipid/cholesterol/gamma-HCH transport system substrate-binding protein
MLNVGRGRRVVVGAVIALSVTASACSLQTVGAPGGSLTLRADFPDAQGLVVGNTVQVSNVVIGSVRAIHLDRYRAQVTLSITDGHPIPVGTSATIAQTSLLGEYYVALTFPPGFDAATSRRLADDALITDTSTEPDVEELAGEVGDVVGALGAGNLGAIVQATAQALDGRGPELHQLAAQASQLSSVLAAQNGNLSTIVDDLGSAGATLAPLSPQISADIDSLSQTTQSITADRSKVLAAISGFTQLAQTTSEDILEPHAQQFLALTQEANAVLGSLVANGTTIEQLFDNFATFVPNVTKAVSDSQLLVFAWADPDNADSSSDPSPESTARSLPVPNYIADLLQ